MFHHVHLELGHIPVGMEMFSAADDRQRQLIQRQIDESDYYIVIAAHRYGSMAGDASYITRVRHCIFRVTGTV
ncbi:MAG: DUF4062 domain-containing protein [Chthoniobacterales bacterium]